MNRKKSFLLLFLIPLFAFSLYVSSLFFKTAFVWWDIVLFAAFILSVIALLALSKKALCYLAAALVQAVPAVCALAGLMHSDLALQHYAAYACLCLPPLVLIAAAVNAQNAGTAPTAKKGRKSKSGMSNSFVTVFFFLLQINLIASIVVSAVAIFQQLKTPEQQIDYISLCFSAVIFVFTGITLYLLKKKKAQKNTLILMGVLCCLTLLEQIAYLAWFAAVGLTFVQAIFPLCTVAVLLLEELPQRSEK
ncbi:MAG: hypothetical protein IJI67_05455 [Clostridia bacterium]|nr:hypothetical protein [Clostridia bacterium]